MIKKIAEGNNIEFWQIDQNVYLCQKQAKLDNSGAPVGRRFVCGILQWPRIRRSLYPFAEDV